MKDIYRPISRLLEGSRKNTRDERYKLLPEGFHGDRFLQEVVLDCLSKAEQFVETGTNVGSTLCYVADRFSHIDIASCEPDSIAFKAALKHVENYENVQLYNELSPSFLHSIVNGNSLSVERDTVFWLDAHGYGYEWPLKEEIHFITRQFAKGYIFIDDCKVPDLDCFEWDEYNGQECSIEYIKDDINPNILYSLYYPNYTQKTSVHHPLRGWCLIEYGHNKAVKLPEMNIKKC